MHLYIYMVSQSYNYARTANGIDFLDRTVFDLGRPLLAAKVGLPGPNLGD